MTPGLRFLCQQSEGRFVMEYCTGLDQWLLYLLNHVPQLTEGHNGTGGSIAASQLQGRHVNPELKLWSVHVMLYMFYPCLCKFSLGPQDFFHQ